VSLRIVKSPSHPLGGHAQVIFPDSSVGMPDQTSLRLMRLEDDQYLGANGWTPNEQLLGPYPVERLGQDFAITIGPEVVNQMIPFQRIRLSLLEVGHEADLDWPDDIAAVQARRVRGRVMSKPSQDAEDTASPAPLGGKARTPAPGAQVVGGRTGEPGTGDDPSGAPVSPAAPHPEPRQPAAPEPRTTSGPVSNAAGGDSAGLGAGPGAGPGAAQGAGPDVGSAATRPPAPEPDDKAKNPRDVVIAVIALIALAVIGGALYFLLQDGDPDPTPVEVVTPEPETQDPAPREVEPETPASDGACQVDAARDGTAAERWEVAQACIAEDRTDEALEMIERLVAEGFGPAQRQLGKWYDPNDVGATPMRNSNPNTALRLYLDARKNGVENLDGPIDQLCKTLEQSSGLSAEVTFDKYCKGN